MKRDGVGGCELGWENGGALGLGTAEPVTRYGFCLGATEVVGSVCRSGSVGGGNDAAVATVMLWSVTEVGGRTETVGRVDNSIGLVSR
jgi:hypothetical protein